VRPGELAADLDDLLGGLALGEDDLREADAPEAIEIERVVLAAHPAGILCGGCAAAAEALWFVPFALFESFGQGKWV